MSTFTHYLTILTYYFCPCQVSIVVMGQGSTLHSYFIFFLLSVYHYIHHRVIAHNIVPGVVNRPVRAVLTFLFSPLVQNHSASLVTPWFLPLTRTLRVSLPEVALLHFFTSLSSLFLCFPRPVST